jgi:hypothetical protein
MKRRPRCTCYSAIYVVRLEHLCTISGSPDDLQSLLQRIPERVWTPRRPTLTNDTGRTQNYPMDRGTRALPANLTRA